MSTRFGKFNILSLVLFLLLGSLTIVVSQQPGPMTLSYNKKYFSSGVVSLQLKGINLTEEWNPKEFNISYPFSFTDPVKGIFLSIINILTDHTTKQISFHGVVGSFDQTSMLLRVFCNFKSNKIQLLDYRYTAYTSKYFDDFNWKWLVVNQKVGQQVSNKYDLKISTYTPLNISGGVTALFSLTGFDYEFKRQIYQKKNSQFKNLMVNLELNQEQGQTTNTLAVTFNLHNMVVHLRSVHFNMMVYNTDFYTHNPHVQIETIYPSTNYYHNDFISNSVVYGYNGREEEDEESAIEFAFNTEFKDLHAFMAGYSHFRQGIVIFHYYVLSFIKSYYCSYETPYYHAESNLCYAQCPPSTIKEERQLICAPSFIMAPEIPKQQQNEKFSIPITVIILLVAFVAVYYLCLKKSKKNAPSFELRSDQLSVEGGSSHQQQRSRIGSQNNV